MRMLSRVRNVAVAVAILSPAMSSFGLPPSRVPPLSEWTAVACVEDEYDHVRQQRCICTGEYAVSQQASGTSRSRKFDELKCVCSVCGVERSFFFDVQSMFDARAFASSADEHTRAHAELGRRFPTIALDALPQLSELLQHQNPHYRTWAVAVIGSIDADAAREALLDGFLKCSLIGSTGVYVVYEKTLAASGAVIVPQIARRVAAGSPEARWKLIELLGDYRTEASRLCVEQQLRDGPQRNRRAGYIALGRIAARASEALLLAEAARQEPNPDDALLWALGHCGSEPSFALLRRNAKDGAQAPRLAAIAALGVASDRESTPLLMSLAQDINEDGAARRNAIYALGHLRVTNAVPFLIAETREPKFVSSYGGATGIYGDDDELCPPRGHFIDVSAIALGRIGDRRAIAELRRLLSDERFDSQAKAAAKAAAIAGWKELAPDIARCLIRTHSSWFRDDSTIYDRLSPPLRELTGEPFGEDPQAWQRWLDQQPTP
ncbi:MAG: HEAT repeat domain-containing protein [Phycisphaerae bacterium]